MHEEYCDPSVFMRLSFRSSNRFLACYFYYQVHWDWQIPSWKHGQHCAQYCTRLQKVMLSSGSYNLPRNGRLSPFARQCINSWTAINTLCNVSCSLPDKEEGSRESAERFYWLMSTNCCDKSCANHCQGLVLFENIVFSVVVIVAKRINMSFAAGVCYPKWLMSQQNFATSCPKRSTVRLCFRRKGQFC